MKQQIFLTSGILERRSRKYLIVLVILASFLSCGFPALATPPEMPSLPDPITACIVFVYFPDVNGQFEVEILYEANFDIKWLSLQVAHTEEITFDEVT